jgi:ubiquinone/menaquinone biosynthesis C-methylase UbiE
MFYPRLRFPCARQRRRERKQMKLEIGCGASPRGDMNCDLLTADTLRRLDVEKRKPKELPNFMRCGANHLPFRSKVFDECCAHHVLEHKPVKPKQTVNEMLRVTNGIVKIVVPHRFMDAKRPSKHHARTFNIKTLDRHACREP